MALLDQHCALTLAALLTAAAGPVFVNAYAWVGVLALGGVGILAVTADNPLTLLLVWASLDLTELLHPITFGGRKNQ